MHQMRKAHCKGDNQVFKLKKAIKREAIKTHLEQPVEGNHRGQQAREELNHGEDAKGDPVDEPLGVILLRAGFDRMYRNVGGIQHTDDVAQQLGAVAEDQIEGAEAGGT